MALPKVFTCEELGNQHGFKCPRCLAGDRLMIAAIQWHALLPDGTDNHGDVEWEDTSPAACSGCEWHGTVKDLIEVPMDD